MFESRDFWLVVSFRFPWFQVLLCSVEQRSGVVGNGAKRKSMVLHFLGYDKTLASYHRNFFHFLCVLFFFCMFFCLDAKEPKDQGFIKIG